MTKVSPVDALPIINDLNRGSAGDSADGGDTIIFRTEDSGTEDGTGGQTIPIFVCPNDPVEDKGGMSFETRTSESDTIEFAFSVEEAVDLF